MRYAIIFSFLILNSCEDFSAPPPDSAMIAIDEQSRARIEQTSNNPLLIAEFNRVQSQKMQLRQSRMVCGMAMQLCRRRAVQLLSDLSYQYPFLCFTRGGNNCDALRQEDHQLYRNGRRVFNELERYRRQEEAGFPEGVEPVNFYRLHIVINENPDVCRYLRPDWTICDQTLDGDSSSTETEIGAPTDVAEARFLSGNAPAYPLGAIEDQIEGGVHVRFDVNDHGQVVNVRIIRSEPEDVFDVAVLNALQTYRFSPRTENGIAIYQYDLESEFNFVFPE